MSLSESLGSNWISVSQLYNCPIIKITCWCLGGAVRFGNNTKLHQHVRDADVTNGFETARG